MQLVILTNRGTCYRYKELNEELRLTSVRLQSCNKANSNNLNYKQVCTVEIRGRYLRSKSVVDQEVLDWMKHQLKEQLNSPKSIAVAGSEYHHTCLHIYAHDGTFGLSYRRVVGEADRYAFLRAHQLTQLLSEYLTLHRECTKIKLHVCFSGCDYGGTEIPYGQLLSQELERYMNNGIIPQKTISVEASNGWSILGCAADDEYGKEWKHHVLPKTEELRRIIATKSKVNYSSLIAQYGLNKNSGKPRWLASSAQ